MLKECFPEDGEGESASLTAGMGMLIDRGSASPRIRK